VKYSLPILFAIGTALCWGLYGPTVSNARDSEKPPRWSPFKPYVFIGVAYIVLGCGGGALGMQVKGDSYNFAGPERAAATWGFLAGSLGALGALSLTSAMLSFPTGVKPKPELVMPIVFGGAVTITAIVAVIQSKNLAGVNPLMWVGMGLVVCGVVMVAYFTPHPAHAGAAPGSAHTRIDAPTDPTTVESTTSGRSSG
jgi:hypothetical protein